MSNIRSNTVSVALLVSASVALCGAGSGPFPPAEFHSTIRKGGHVISITITSKKFDRTKHKMTLDPSGEQLLAGHPHVDGRKPLGVDGYSIPEDEIDRFDVVWDGKAVPVPRELYADCYTPVLSPASPHDHWIGNNLNEEKVGNIQVLGDQKGEALLVIMRSFLSASDCYEVYWTIRADGRHSRFVQDFGS
jgi:hypothetical protein